MSSLTESSKQEFLNILQLSQSRVAPVPAILECVSAIKFKLQFEHLVFSVHLLEYRSTRIYTPLCLVLITFYTTSCFNWTWGLWLFQGADSHKFSCIFIWLQCKLKIFNKKTSVILIRHRSKQIFLLICCYFFFIVFVSHLLILKD